MNDAFAIAAAKINGEPPLLPVAIDFDLKTPCGDCPFLKSSPFHDGVCESLPQYLDSINMNVFAHTCHKTDNRGSVDGPQNFKGERAKHCAGAIICLLKTGKGKDLQLPLLQAAERGAIDLDEMSRIAASDVEVFTLAEMLAFYANGLQARARKLRRRRENKRRGR
jgi:hypothetical protein